MAFTAEPTSHVIRLHDFQYHVKNAIAENSSNSPNARTPEESGIFLSAPSWVSPLSGTPALHMCRYRYYSAHKTPQSHLKVVSCWNTLGASKLGSRLCSTGLALLLHITFPSNGEWLQTHFSYTNLFPSSKPSKGLHWKEAVYFW